MNLIESLVKGRNHYVWYEYTGKTPLTFGEKRQLELKKGDVFGVRWSSNKKDIRIVLEGELTKVATVNSSYFEKVFKPSNYILASNAQRRIYSAVMLESELTKKQEQLDINHDGKISKEDLKRLRNGEKANRAYARLSYTI